MSLSKRTIFISASIIISLIGSFLNLNKASAFGVIDELRLTSPTCSKDFSTTWYAPVRTRLSHGNSSSFIPQIFDIYDKNIKNDVRFRHRYLVYKSKTNPKEAIVIVNYRNYDKYSLYLKKSPSSGGYYAQFFNNESGRNLDIRPLMIPHNNQGLKNWQEYDFYTFYIGAGDSQNCSKDAPYHIGNYYFFGSNLIIGSDSDIFLSNFKLKYDNNYDGPYPNDFFKPKRILKPSFNYKLKGNKLTAQVYHNIDPALDYYNKMKVKYTLGHYNEQDNEVIDDEKTLSVEQEYTFNFVDNSPHTDYFLAVQFQKGENPKEEYKFVEWSVKIDYKGVNTEISGVSDNWGNFPLSEPPQFQYEVCDNLDIACHLRNFGTKIREIFTGLFVPDANTFRQDFDDLKSFFASKLGFLADSVGLVVSSFNSMLSASPSCSLSFSGSGASLFASGWSVNLCVLQQKFPQLFDFGLLVIRGSLVFGLVFSIYKKLKGVLKT